MAQTWGIIATLIKQQEQLNVSLLDTADNSKFLQMDRDNLGLPKPRPVAPLSARETSVKFFYAKAAAENRIIRTVIHRVCKTLLTQHLNSMHHI